MWLKELKIAIIEKNTGKISSLLEDIPKGLSQDELLKAQYLLKGANELIQELQKNTQSSMLQMKKNIDFLNATKAPHTSKLDVKS
ncbi:MAG: hypothetical protein SPLUMA1_SPLUMAMAG1_00583 [uncultured Sulfurimonas sp.]|nr:MAG: hypothetical protein SPLUMA1_SPLUMAMAG1_00583 [uncultured Sulfurimonas sp.]